MKYFKCLFFYYYYFLILFYQWSYYNYHCNWGIWIFWPLLQWTGLLVYTAASGNQRTGSSQPASHTYWLTASLHNGSFLFPYPVLYHYRHVPGKDNDMYIYSTWVTCLIGSHRAGNPSLSSLKLSLLFLFIPLSSSADIGHLLFVP